MPPAADPSSRRVLSYRVLAAVILGGVGLSYVLVPSQRELLDRLHKDELCARIAPLVEQGWFGKGKTPIELLNELPREQLATLAQLIHLTPREQLKRIFDPRRPVEYDAFIHYLVLSAVQYVDVIPPVEAFSLISPMSSRIPAGARADLFHILAKNALGMDDPKTAARILRQVCKTTDADWELIAALVEADRWSEQPASALTDLRAWTKRHQDSLPVEKLAESEALQYELALEAGLPQDALELCLTQLADLPEDQPLPEDLMEKAHRAAVFSGRSKDFLPYVERHLAAFPQAKLSWRELIPQSAANPQEFETYRLWTRRAAEIADWHALAKTAYLHHLRLLAMHETAALDRYIPLADYLGLGEESASVLLALGPVPGKENVRITLARLTASNGNSVVARKMFEEWVRDHPDDQAARYELACLLEGITDLKTSIPAFESYLRDFPADVKAVKKLATLLIRAGQYETALQHLDALQESDFDHNTLEDYTMLAESLDRLESLMRALDITIGQEREVKPEIYLRRAEVARHISGDTAYVAALKEAIQHLPQSPSLHIELATAYLEQERFVESLDVSLDPVLDGRVDAMSLALAAAIHTDRSDEVVSRLGQDFETHSRLTVAARLDMAVACQLAGDSTRSERLFASVEEGPATWVPLAESRLMAGQMEEAARLALLNLSKISSPKAQDWVLLGDVRSQQGLTDAANEAYARALQLVTSEFSRRPVPVARVEPDD